MPQSIAPTMEDYLQQFQSRFIAIMRWDACQDLLQELINKPEDWYIYNTLEKAPSQVASAEAFIKTINTIKKLLASEQEQRYRGIVYVNDCEKPNFVKVFHPQNLGKACGSNENPPIPLWLLSKTKPTNIIKKIGGDKHEPRFISKFFKL